MKQLNTPGTNGDWNNNLIRDLTFIKAKKRYPLSKRTIAPMSLIALVVLALARVSWPLIFVSAQKTVPTYVAWLLYTLLGGLVINVCWQFIRVIQFKAINTPFLLQENIALLKKFLQANHLAYTQHPEAPEVFMILSRNLETTPGKEYREVMVFIADDRQILVNSHFTGTKKLHITPPSRNYKKMADSLRDWLHTHISENDKGTLPVKRF